MTDTRYASHWDDDDLSQVAEMTDRLEPKYPLGKGNASSGAMICLYPHPDVQDALAVPGGLPSDEIHLTLVYLGPAASLNQQQKDQLRSRIQQVAASTDSLRGRVVGGGSFPEGDDGVPVFARPRIAGVRELRGRLADLSASEHPFSPHITRAYVPPGEENTIPPPPPCLLDFDAIWLVIGGVRTRFPFRDAVEKAEAHPTVLHLRVHGVSKGPGGMRVYRMASRDGHYVGRTLPTRVRARKGDVLKVQTGDFLQDVQGDMRWVNPNVVSHYSDAPHSWRELAALAGGAIAKDAAPGPAGDLPPAGDLGASSSMPSMPTLDAVGSGFGPDLSAVHVNVPLPDISVSYVGEKRKRKRKKADDEAEQPDDSVLRGEFLPVQKAGQWKQLVYGVVLEPNVMDSQDDFMLPHHVEKAAHEYMKRIVRGNASVMKLQHREQGFKKTQPSIVPVESFIAPVDFHLDSHELVKKGSWVLVAKVEDSALWQDFLDGKYTGFSIGGTGIRRSVGRGNYSPDVPDGYMPQEPADWSQPIPDPGYFTPVF